MARRPEILIRGARNPDGRRCRTPVTRTTADRRSIPVNLGVTELLIVLAVVLLLFGSTRLPALAKSLGQAKHEFEHGHSEAVSQTDPS